MDSNIAAGISSDSSGPQSTTLSPSRHVEDTIKDPATWTKLRSFVSRKLTYGDYDETQEIVQLAMIKAYNARNVFQDKAQVGSWLFQIAKNTFLQRRQQQQCNQQRHVPLDADFVNPDTLPQLALPALEDETVEKEFGRAKRAAKRRRARRARDEISKLPRDMQQVAHLRFEEGKPYQEIADTTGIPLGTVRSKLFRIRERLNRPRITVRSSKKRLAL